MVVVVTGVAGAGKTTIGRALAASLGWSFYDADDLHAPDAVAQMARGEGLSEAQRAPWLARVRGLVERLLGRGEDAVVACSALRRTHRSLVADGLPEVRIVFLHVPPALARERLVQRPGHFAGTALVDSQFAALEPPVDALALDASAPVETLVEQIRARI